MKSRQAEGDKVIDMKAGRKVTRREAELVAEAILKDHPSPECRAFIDAQHSDPQAVERDGGLMTDALDAALTGNYLGYATISAVKRRAEQFKQRLGYQAASPAEQMLIEHAVLCHARLGVVEQLHAYATRGTHSKDNGLYWERRLTLTQHRFDRAITTLARTRALLARAEAARAQAERAQAANGLRAVGTRAA